jgi:5-methylcytosine-specific restriction endonuclease McrA
VTPTGRECELCRTSFDLSESIATARQLLQASSRDGESLSSVYERLATSRIPLTVEQIAVAEAEREPLLISWATIWVEDEREIPVVGLERPYVGPGMYLQPVYSTPTTQPAVVAMSVRMLIRRGYAVRQPDGFAAVLACSACQYDATARGARLTHRSPERREPLPARLRFEVLQRDSFRCRYCGRSASDGAILHIDHLVPVARGGTDEIENLTTACDRCNLGKGTQEIV